MKLLSLLEKSKDFYFLLITSFTFFLLRLPSLFEPYWYGDEGIYQVLGIAMRSGRLLYRDIWDNKPPLLYTLYAVFSSDQFTIRLVSLIVGILCVIVFFFLARKFFNRQITFLTTAIFSILFALPIIEGNIANAENFMMLPILAAALLIYKQILQPVDSRILLNSKFLILNSKLIFAGLLLSIAFLFKIVAIFDFSAFTLFLFFILLNKNNLIKSIFCLFPLIIGFIAPIILTAVFFLLSGGFWEFYNAAFSQNVGYVGYGNKLLIGQGFLLLKLIILGLFALFLFVKRKTISHSALFILFWLAFSVFNAGFAGRPYTHYLLTLLPSFCLFSGLLFSNKKYQKISIIILFLAITLIFKNFWVYSKTVSYYENFIFFVLNKKSVSSYQSFFDRQTPVDYELAQYIKANAQEKDNIFIWGNNAQVYKLVNKLPPGRFTVAYHASASKETLKETLLAANKANPKYIIVTSPKNLIPFSLVLYKQKINIGNSIIYERNY